MGHSQADKAKSRERILAAAAKEIRENGLDSVSVGSLMKQVGLTHGGFYGHFASRSELIAEALRVALVEGETVAKAAVDPGKPRTYSAIVRSYLSRAHRDTPDSGCAIAALAVDVGRADEHSRAVMEEHIERFITKLEEVTGDEKEAIVAISALVGALTLSRVVTDPKRSDAILKAVRDGLCERQQ